MTPRAPDPGADPSSALAQIKSSVRGEPPYRSTPRDARHKLNQNESPYDLPPEIKREVLERLAALPWNRYPEAVPRGLIDRLAKGCDWTADGVVAGCGSNDLIQTLLSIVVAPKDAVVAPSPTFALYRRVVAVQGGRYVPVPLKPSFEYDVDALINAAQETRAKAVVLCAPNNPTGTDLGSAEVRRVLEGTEGLVLVDEAYRDFGGASAAELLRSFPRLVIFRTLSKAPGIAGLRFGFLLAHPALATEVLKAKLPYDISGPTLGAVDVVLDHAEALRARSREILAERDRLMTACRALPGVEVVPSVANFFLLRVRGAARVAEQLLTQHSVLVRDLSAQPGLEECLRVSVGTAADSEALMSGLRTILGAAS